MAGQQTTPVTDDAHATAPELLARAAQDFAAAQVAATQRQNQGDTGVRQGVLPGSPR